MNDQQYLEHCDGLLTDYAKSLRQCTEHVTAGDPVLDLVEGFENLSAPTADIYEEGPALIKRLFTTYPELAPALPRQLLWFFGGDCLHYMPDEEIDRFQQLEDRRLDAATKGEVFNLRDARAKLLNLQ
jgi:hypothetical protein